ncbi:hypothetical protein SAMN05421850_102423 [Lutimaribacter saemankumensis]|uniref:Uncharacterized protein n=1 Tax=Lutimaribacter saemankumensis TaxID=490829 RepID=A0A1G8K6U8_9RHOB|nr:hypothetical protein SAMN05421850_102423 [Lutimaribacter saemankumensis]
MKPRAFKRSKRAQQGVAEMFTISDNLLLLSCPYR